MAYALKYTFLTVSFALSLCIVPQAQAIRIDFATETQLANHFSTYAPRGETYIWSAQPGAGGTQGRLEILPSTGHNAAILYTHTAFDLNAGALDASFMLQGVQGQSGAAPRIALLLHTGKEAVNPSAPSLGVVWTQDGEGRQPARLKAGGNTVQQPAGETDASQSDGLAAFSPGHWYLFGANWSLTEDQTSILIRAELWDYGADGTQAGERLAVVTAQITDPTLFGKGGVVRPLYLGLVAQSGIGGAAALDTIQIDGSKTPSHVPEPTASAALIALCGTALYLYKRARLTACGSAASARPSQRQHHTAPQHSDPHRTPHGVNQAANPRASSNPATRLRSPSKTSGTRQPCYM